MSYVLVLLLGIGIGSAVTWAINDRDGAKQLWADVQALIAKARGR
jgi:hypothetical protein